MKRKFRSARRVARGVFGPSKKTLRMVKAGMQRRSQRLARKITALEDKMVTAFEGEAKKGNAGKIAFTLKTFSEDFYSILREYDSNLAKNNPDRIKMRLVTKYALDAMNITGKKRRRIFQIIEAGYEHSLLREGELKGKAAPGFTQQLFEELGPAKALIFAQLLHLKGPGIERRL